MGRVIVGREQAKQGAVYTIDALEHQSWFHAAAFLYTNISLDKTATKTQKKRGPPQPLNHCAWRLFIRHIACVYVNPGSTHQSNSPKNDPRTHGISNVFYNNLVKSVQILAVQFFLRFARAIL
jgi:hypothetical protein